MGATRGFSPPRSYGEGPGVGLFAATIQSFRSLRKQNALHRYPSP